MIEKERTQAPSDVEHCKILMARTFRKDLKKPGLWFARFLSLPLIFMLYTIGSYLGYQENSSESVVPGSYRFYDGNNWTFPASMRLGGFDSEYVTRIGDTIHRTISSVSVVLNYTQINDATSLSEECTFSLVDKLPTEEICVYFRAPENYDIYYWSGTEYYIPPDLVVNPVAGAQWAVNTAILSEQQHNGTLLAETFPVDTIQPTPDIIQSTNIPGYVLLLPVGMYVLSACIMTQFLVGPITYEKINYITKSYLLVGVKMRTYLLQWILYYGMWGLLTAGVNTIVSVYWLIMPMSSPGLIFASHYLGLVQVYATFTLLMQFVTQEELAQGLPFITGIISAAAAIPLVMFQDPDSIWLTILSAVSPFVGMVQYHAIYITYDSLGFNTGVHLDKTFTESGLLGNMIAQGVGIIFWIVAIHLYSSPTFGYRVPALFSNQNRDDNVNDNTNTTREAIQERHDSNFEPLAPGSEIMMSVRGLEHTYHPTSSCDKNAKPTEVLKGLDLDIVKGEVFGYLGHNGAGKTTSVQILSTELKLQHGNITYHFKEGDTGVGNPSNQSSIRTKIGVCPQHNSSLANDLTCRETLRLFAYLKGGILIRQGESIDEAVESEVERRLEDVKFTSEEDADKLVSTYSGGMQRKVLIALALLGDPQVVFLDEPTAGLDPYNRRTIWDMIIAAKKDRSIILTTHFLDEADILSDRIGIIKDGRLLTCGTSLFLKYHFGVGYTLKFEADEPYDVTSIMNDAEELTSSVDSRDHQWRIKHGNESLLPELLYGLSKWGATKVEVGLTTLEEVFLKTGKEDQEKDDDKDDMSEDGSDEESDGEVDLEADENKYKYVSVVWSRLANLQPLSATRKFLSIQNFMMKNAWKIRGSVFINVIMPLIYVVIGFAISAGIDQTQKGEIITTPPNHIAPRVMPGYEGKALFFGLPSFNDSFNPISPLEVIDAPVNIEDYFMERTSPILGGYYAENMTLQYDPYVDAFALPIGISILSNYSVLMAGSNNTETGIATTFQKLPYEADSPFRIDLIILPLFLSFGFVGVAFAVLDALLLRGDNIVELFRVAGINEWYTYLGITSYKLLTHFIPFFLLVIILGLATNSVLFGNGGRWLATLLTMFLYAFSVAPQGLILAKRFIHSDFKSVANWFPGVYMTLISIPYGAWSTVLQVLPEQRELITFIGDAMCLIPQMAFQRCLGAILEISAITRDDSIDWANVWSFNARVWLPMLLMIFTGTLEWMYLYRLTMTREAKTIMKEEEAGAKDPINVQDNPDIVAERELGLKDNQGINARDLVKNFKVKPEKDSKSKHPIIKRAVKGVSFGIRKNEIYALLGPNGSGKTVTMSMLAGKYTPCFGAVALDGAVAVSNDSSIDHLYNRCNVAYCPQFDALFPNNTVKEHMEFYATIRGLDLNERAAQDHISAIVKLLGLKKYLSKKTTELSGGYKRRLSLAIAVIGYPNVLIVDEVTTGIDPGARREIWDLLKPSSAHDDFDIPATILSSHYMDECQELGTRIGILIDGEIVATGNLSRLNELFCTSYFVEISLESHVGEDAEQNVIDIFEKHHMIVEIYEKIPFRLKFRVPFAEGSGHNDTKQLASIFKLLEENKESIGIKFYSVAPMNLEQIFIDLSRKQFAINSENN